jgi:hypothetical protein
MSPLLALARCRFREAALAQHVSWGFMDALRSPDGRFRPLAAGSA